LIKPVSNGYLLTETNTAGVRITTRQLASLNANGIQDWRVKIQTRSPVSGKGFFPLSLTLIGYIFGQMLSDLATENAELLASLASVLKKTYPHPCNTVADRKVVV
jgi:hypothetical protein